MKNKFGIMEKVISLCKRRGFVYPGSEIYGGLANTWDYGPLGVELKKNILKDWWKTFVQDREDVFGLDAAILMNPKVWHASGHVTRFNDPLVDCRNCQARHRADHLIEKTTGENLEGHVLEELNMVIEKDNRVTCPNCDSRNLTRARKFNLLFKTFLGPVENDKSTVYLRGETAQGIFVNFKNVVNSFSPKLPFGIAQIGKAFRNEVSPGNFIFRVLEMEQMEIEYFVRQSEWKKYYQLWKGLMFDWLISLGARKKKLRWRKHTKHELSHYSTLTYDLEYDFPFGGYKEVFGFAYRTDFDLKNHAKHSGKDLTYTDPKTGKKIIPHVVEPSFGAERSFLVVLIEAYCEEKKGKEKRVVLKLKPKLAPIKIAVFPLLSNKKNLVKKAREVFESLKNHFPTMWDDRGNIGKRYFSQDEIGTPWCVTIDFDTLKDDTVTVRDRDTTKQKRLKIEHLTKYFFDSLGG